MSSLRTVFGILILSAIAYGVYVSLTRNPRTGERLETAPAWNGTAATSPAGPAAKGGTVAGFQSPGGTAGARPPAVGGPVLNLGTPSGPPPGIATPSGTAPGTAAGAAPPGQALAASPGSPMATLKSTIGPPPGGATAPAAGQRPAASPIAGLGGGATAMATDLANPPGMAMAASPPAASVLPPPSAQATPTPVGTAPSAQAGMAGPLGTAAAAAPAGTAGPSSPPGLAGASSFPMTSTPQAGLPPLGPAGPAATPAAGAPAAATTGQPNPGTIGPLAMAGGTAAPAAPGGGKREEFQTFLQALYASLNAGRLGEAQLHLSAFYNRPGLSPEESQKVTELLDQLAGTVIYSRQHLLEPPYRTLPGDTLQKIGQDYGIPAELLAKINGLRDGQPLAPGTELKVIRGPFDAVIDLPRYELTMFLKGRYAGRFRIGVGRDYPPPAGTFTVREKKVSPMFFGPDRTIDAGDPANPLGRRLLDLGQQVAIHGTNSPQGLGRNDGRGSIFLNDREIDDVFDILSVGSTVTIRR